MQPKEIFAVLVAFSALILICACGQHTTEWQGVIEEVDGITVVKNPIEPMYGPEVFSLEQDLSIGVINGPNELIFENIWQVVVDDDENIFVSEWQGNLTHIKVFDKSGTYLRTIGKQGQGPGEFFQPSNIQLTPMNELLVYDRYQRKLIVFDLVGNCLRTILLPKIEAFSIQVSSEGNYLAIGMDYQKQTSENTIIGANEAKVYDKDFQLEKTIIKDKYRESRALQAWMMIRFVDADSIMCGLSETYEIYVYDSEGDVVKKVTKNFNPVIVNDNEIQKRGLNREKDLPKHFPAFQNLYMDDEGRIFVQTYKRYLDEDRFFFDIFDPEGKYIVNTLLPGAPKYWKNGRMYTVEEDEDGFQFIKRYNVTWNY